MSLQWTLVASFLYAEITLCILFLLPIIPAGRWRQIFRSRLLSAISYYSNIYFMVFMIILAILFIDALRDVWRYSSPIKAEDAKLNPHAEVHLHMKLFRSQRNIYIAGFALFIFWVLRRLITMISQHALLQVECEAAQKQAVSATEAAQRFMTDKDSEENKKEDTAKIDSLTAELKKTKADLSALKKQSESTNREYDRLTDEYKKLQDKLEEKSDSKKDG